MQQTRKGLTLLNDAMDTYGTCGILVITLVKLCPKLDCLLTLITHHINQYTHINENKRVVNIYKNKCFFLRHLFDLTEKNWIQVGLKPTFCNLGEHFNH